MYFSHGGKVLLLVFWLLLGLGSAASGQDEPEDVPLPPGTLTAAEVLELFSDRTVESITAVRGRVSTSYYSPDGEIRQLRQRTERFGRWRVKENGRICLQMEDLPEKCRVIVKDGEGYKKYIVKKNGQHQHTITYRKFRRGNPLGL